MSDRRDKPTDGEWTDQEELVYELRLYVAGLTPHSQKAIRNVTAVCQQYLAGHFDLEIIDIYQQPTRAKSDQIIAVPTLVKQLPRPMRKLVGSMADRRKILAGLDLASDIYEAS
jgi:circadian clock protein KaiB